MAAPPQENLFPAAIAQVERQSALKVLALCSSPRATPDTTRVVEVGPWRHVAELEYLGPRHPSIAMWNDFSILRYLVHTAISIPPRNDNRSDPWVVVSCVDGATTAVPRGYRIPLLWLARVQWESLKLLLTAARPLWDLIKYDVLHIARLTTQFLAKARDEPRMKRQWRDPMFDHAVMRFFHGWMGCSAQFIWDFFKEFEDEEYKEDLLTRTEIFPTGWEQKVPKGIQGFSLSEQELLNGITAQQFMAGLVLREENQTFEWIAEPEPGTPPPKADESRGSSPLTSELGSDVEMAAESSNPKTSEPATPVPTPMSMTPKPPQPPPILTGSELPPKKPPKKVRTKADREKDRVTRPLRSRTMSSSISALSPATPKVAHLARPDMNLSASASGSPNPSPLNLDFTAPVESRGRKRKIESVYSVSPLTSDAEDEVSSGKASAAGPNRAPSRPLQSVAPDGRAFDTNSRIVVPRLSNVEIYPKAPTGAEGAGTPVPVSAEQPQQQQQQQSSPVKTPRKPSTSEPSPRKVRSPASALPIQHYKLYAISSSPSTNPFDPTNPATSAPSIQPFHTWRHHAELDYIGPNHPLAGEWTDIRILTFMADNVYSIPSRSADNRQTWVEVKIGPDPAQGKPVTVPRGYRIPLLWLGKVQWDCVKLLLSTGKEQWGALKWDVLHIARLASEFLGKAGREVKMKRGYRDVMFDRPLCRFNNGWMGSRDEFVWDFYREFRDEEYEDDMLRRRWLQKAVKGIQEFSITEQELQDGISAEDYMRGLELDREMATFRWVVEDAPEPAPEAVQEPPTPQETTPAPAPVPTPTRQSTPTPTPTSAPAPAPPPQREETLRVEVPPVREKSPLSLSQVANVHSASPSPLTPNFGVDLSMEVDRIAGPADNTGRPMTRTAKEDERELIEFVFAAPDPVAQPVASSSSSRSVSVVGEQLLKDPPTPSWDVPQPWEYPHSTPPAADITGNEDVVMDGADEAPPPVNGVDVPGNDNIDELEDDILLGYPPSESGSPLAKASAHGARPDPLGAPILTSTAQEDEPEFDEKEFLRSRLPSPFVATPQHETSPKAVVDPVPPAEPVSTPASPQHSSIRSSSSPEPRPLSEVPEQQPSSPEERVPSPPPDSEEEEGPTQGADVAPSQPTESTATDIDVVHILPLSPLDTVEDIPPGFHFIGMPPGATDPSQLDHILFPPPSQETAVSAIVAPQPQPTDAVQERSTAAPLRTSASPLLYGRAQSPVVEPPPPTTRLTPVSVSAETVLSQVSPTDDSKQVKLEIMTQSLPGGEDRPEDEEDMDMGTPIDVDMEDRRSISPPAVSATSRVASPPLTESQSLFTPDTTPRSAAPSAVAAANRAANAARLRLDSPSVSTPPQPSVSFATNDEAMAPGLSNSSARAPPAAMPDNKVYNTPTPSHRSPTTAGPPPQRFMGRGPPPSQNPPHVNGREPASPAFFMNGGGRLFLRDKPPTHPLPPRPDIRHDGGGIRIPDTSNEYDPRRRDIVLGPSSAYAMPLPHNMRPNMQPGVQPGSPFGRWMGPTPGGYHSPYSPLLPMPPRRLCLPRRPFTHHRILTAASQWVARFPVPVEVKKARDAMPPANRTPDIDMDVENRPVHDGRSSRDGRPPREGRSVREDRPFREDRPLRSRSPSTNSLRRPAPVFVPATISVSSSTSRAPTPAPAAAPVPAAPAPAPAAAAAPTPPPPAPAVVPVVVAPPSQILTPPVIDMESLENSVVLRLKDNLRSQLKDELMVTLKGELRSELRNELKGDLKSELRDELRDKLKIQLKGELQGELKDELHGELKGQLHDGLKGELHRGLKGELHDGLKGELHRGLKDALHDGLRAELHDGLKGELYRGLKGELHDGLKGELQRGLKGELHDGLRGDLQDGLRGELRDDLRVELRDSLRNLLRDELQAKLRDELRVELQRELRGELHGELKGELRNELRTELRGELRAELKSELETSLSDQLRGELMDGLKSELKSGLKGELRGELKEVLGDELRVELRDQLRVELTGEVKGELVQLRQELPGQLRPELLGQLRDDLFGLLKDDLVPHLKGDLLTQLIPELQTQLKPDLLDQLKPELLVQLQDDLLLRLKDELLGQLQTDFLALLKDDLKVQLTDDLEVTLRQSLRELLRADLKEDIVFDVKDHFSEQLKDQLRIMLEKLKNAVNSQLRDDLIIQLKYFVSKLKEELIVQLKDTLTVHLKDGLINQVKTALTTQLRDGLGAQREQLNLDFERRRLFLEQQPRIKAAKPPSSAVSTPSRPTPTTPRPLPSAPFQARHPLHHLVLSPATELPNMDVDAFPNPPPTPPVLASPTKPRESSTPLPVKSQRKQSWLASGYQTSQASHTPEAA
ncbi:hypothetical protein R3P38DRAFT_3370346 [Favolaschia claudopus]|uniref:ELK domain-containing protein n=1 Tax=Favolaschia claudopus TaxID=2862362 RepID=A0AAW0A1Q4_9AGAR